MRAAGASTWHGLATAREGSQLIAHVDDERFRNGAYEFRAHAVDQAGNEASTGRRADGSAATLRLPARIETRLAVGVPRTTVRRRIVRRHGRRRVVRRRIRRLDSHVIARHDRRIRLGGFLANSDGQPIEGATIEALETQPDGATAAVGLATTDADGRFKYVVKATRNRELVFRYGGSRRIGSATSDFVLLVPASTSIRPDRRRLRNGQQVRLHRTSPDEAAAQRREARRDAGLLPRPLANVLDGSRGQWRRLALPIPLRRHGWQGHVQIPRPATFGGRLPLHQWKLARREGGGSGRLTRIVHLLSILGPDEGTEPC